MDPSGALTPGAAFFRDKLAFVRSEPRALRRRAWLDAGVLAGADGLARKVVARTPAPYHWQLPRSPEHAESSQ